MTWCWWVQLSGRPAVFTFLLVKQKWSIWLAYSTTFARPNWDESYRLLHQLLYGYGTSTMRQKFQTRLMILCWYQFFWGSSSFQYEKYTVWWCKSPVGPITRVLILGQSMTDERMCKNSKFLNENTGLLCHGVTWQCAMSKLTRSKPSLFSPFDCTNSPFILSLSIFSCEKMIQVQ